MKKVKERNFKKKIVRPKGGRWGSLREPCAQEPQFFCLLCILSLRSQPRQLRNMLAPQTTRMLLRRGPHRSAHRHQRQQS